MDEIKKDLKLVQLHVHLGLLFPKKRMKPILFILTPAMYVAHKLSVNEVWQFKFNVFFTAFWFSSMFFIPAFPFLYGHSTPALIIQEISLWANFATHLGALGANLSAIISDQRLANPE